LFAEIFVTSFGVLFTLGVIGILVGGSMVFDMPEVSDLTVSFWSVLVPVVFGFAAAAALIVFVVTRSMFRAQTAGVDELLGLVGKARTALTPDGKVFIRGEYWDASADAQIEVGEAVEVTRVEGLRLHVRRASPP
jgi:membrane-bound serine protease (ClpP class)